MKKLFYNIWIYVRLFFLSIFYGMESANKIITSQTSNDSDSGIHQNLKSGGVINDMLEQKVTKEVEEIRDSHYRILKEADKFDTSTIQIIGYNEDGSPIFSTQRLGKKTKVDFMKHSIVYETSDTKLRTIQDNKKFSKTSNFGVSIPNGVYDYDTTLTITRDGIIPRIYIEKFVKKMVVRETSNPQRCFVDFYLATEASQFGKIDAILISNLFNIFETRNFRSDLLDFSSIEWFSDNAWNSPDVCIFKYDDIKPIDINVFDGNFVITFDCNIVSDGEYLAKKYETKEMDEKYETKAPRTNSIDFLYACRKNNEDDNKNEINLTTEGFKL